MGAFHIFYTAQMVLNRATLTSDILTNQYASKYKREIKYL